MTWVAAWITMGVLAFTYLAIGYHWTRFLVLGMIDFDEDRKFDLYDFFVAFVNTLAWPLTLLIYVVIRLGRAALDIYDDLALEKGRGIDNWFRKVMNVK